ncbi:hypothetical protein [Streptomyces sp. NPDC090798]|uniref:hypothetical protein n=1 Tax=Streptomyces sp. NPDC090798 TaxID=3365968 RepID=UPI0037FC1A08
MITNLVNASFHTITEVLQRRLDECGYQVLLCVTDSDPVRERRYLDTLLDHRVDGLIIAGTGDNTATVRQVSAAGIPAPRDLGELAEERILRRIDSRPDNGDPGPEGVGRQHPRRLPAGGTQLDHGPASALVMAGSMPSDTGGHVRRSHATAARAAPTSAAFPAGPAGRIARVRRASAAEA